MDPADGCAVDRAGSKVMMNALDVAYRNSALRNRARDPSCVYKRSMAGSEKKDSDLALGVVVMVLVLLFAALAYWYAWSREGK